MEEFIETLDWGVRALVVVVCGWFLLDAVELIYVVRRGGRASDKEE